jgi:large subunit ribosomal protein L3
MNTLIGKKHEMSSRYDKNGKRLTITAVSVEPNLVVERKMTDKAGYNGIVLGYGSKKKATAAFKTKTAKVGVIPQYMEEIRSDEDVEINSFIKVADVFAVGDLVKVTGVSKGRGFTGVVKRYNFKGGPKTHGQSDRHRARGSLGSGTTPGRVFKGLRMAGRSGGENISVRNLIVAFVNSDTNQILLTGPVPGHRNGYLTITKVGEDKTFTGIDELAKDKKLETVEQVKVDSEQLAVAQEPVTEEVTNVEVVEEKKD